MMTWSSIDGALPRSQALFCSLFLPSPFPITLRLASLYNMKHLRGTEKLKNLFKAIHLMSVSNADKLILEHTLSLFVDPPLPEQGNERLIEGYCSVQVLITKCCLAFLNHNLKQPAVHFQELKGPLAGGLNGWIAQSCSWNFARTYTKNIGSLLLVWNRYRIWS